MYFVVYYNLLDFTTVGIRKLFTLKMAEFTYSSGGPFYLFS